MKTGKIKIVELNIEERVQLAYCGDITFQYYNEKQSTPVIETIRVTDCPDFESCFKFLKSKMREQVKSKRAKDYAKQRRVSGWS